MILTLASGTLVVASIAYYAAALVALRRYWRRPPPESGRPESTRGVSILKPAVGAGPKFLEPLRSHAAQDHPNFEILVGVGPGDCTTKAAVHEVQVEFPSLRIEVVDCPIGSPQHNGKVEILERLARRATEPIWVMTDADILVPRNHLRVLCSELDRPNMGLVTCLYRAKPNRSFASRLEAARINTEFPAQVLLAQWLQGLKFALGSTLALRGETLRKLGGFKSIRPYVGDDYQLGAMVAAGGYRVEVSAVPVVTQSQHGDSIAQVWDRQLRWSRTVRKQRPAGYAGLTFTFATVWSALAVVVQPSDLWPLALLGMTARIATGLMSARVVGSTRPSGDLWLVPAADIAAFAVWLWSYCGSSVSWAGRRMRLGAGGRIVP